MSQPLKLHVKAGSSRCSAVFLTLEAVKAEYELVFHTQEDTKSEAFHKLNPLGRVPVLETEEGNLAYTNVIARWICKKYNKLLGTNRKEELEVESWLEAVRLDLMVARGNFIYQVYGFEKDKCLSKDEFNHHTSHFLDLAQAFEKHLTGKDFLVGSQLSAADIHLIAALEPVLRFVLCPGGRARIPNLVKYFEKHIKEELFKKFYGVFQFPEAPIYICFKDCKKHDDHKKCADDHKKGHDDHKKGHDDHKKGHDEHKKGHEEHKKGDEKKGHEDQKKTEKKKEEKKKEKKDDYNDEDEEEAPKEVKKEYKFPDSAFKLPDFKTLYVNEPDKAKALEHLWAHWDANAYSFWYLNYDKLPTECKKLFLTNNLMTGFIDRAELCRKHAFGVHGVYGEENDYDIRGVWLWRGTDMLEPLKEHQQFDVYKYKKLDPKNEADKKLIEEYWTHLESEKGTVEGRVPRTIKYFK